MHTSNRCVRFLSNEDPKTLNRQGKPYDRFFLEGSLIADYRHSMNLNRRQFISRFKIQHCETTFSRMERGLQPVPVELLLILGFITFNKK